MKIHFILHETFEVPGAYLAWAALSGHDVTMTKVYQDEKLPENVDSFDFLIVMGGPQSPIGDNSEFPYFEIVALFIFAFLGIYPYSFNLTNFKVGIFILCL